MTSIPGTPAGPSILPADDHGPWGGGKGSDGGPRNPWSVPPSGRRGPVKPTALDELLKRARGGGGGGGPIGGGGGGLPRPEPRALWAIGVGVVILLWIVLTSFHSIGPRQRGVVTTLGSYSDTRGPGISLTLPAPFQMLRTVDVQEIRTDNFPQSDAENLMLTGDQNVVDLAYSVRWDIVNPQDYVFQLRDPAQTLRDAAESAMRAVLATTTFTQASGNGRTVVEAKVADLTQRILDGYASGIRIQGVSIRQASPPAQITDDFNAVTVASQEAVGNLNKAQAYANQQIALAQGEATAFDKIYAQYKLAPEVTRRRLYYDTMEAVLARSDKTILESGNAVPYLPLPGARPLPSTPEVTVQAGAGQ